MSTQEILLRITCKSVRSASVHGNAPSESYGGWTVLQITSDEVAFVATVNASLMPAEVIGDFHISATTTGTGLVHWYSVGNDICYAGYVNGPAEAMIPTVSEWGLIIMAGLLLTVGAIVIKRRCKIRLV